VYAVANIGITQMMTWMPKYFEELGHGGIPPLIFTLQSALAIPLLLLTSSYSKHWTPRYRLATMSGGVLGMALAYILLSWLASRDIVLAAGFMVCSALFVELAVLPVVNTFVAQVMPARRLGFGFGLLGLSDVGGTVVGIMIGTSLYARAQQAGNLSDYWRVLGIICTTLGVVGLLWGLLNPGWARVLRSLRRGHAAGTKPITECVRGT
jgi:hypothetical protein